MGFANALDTTSQLRRNVTNTPENFAVSPVPAVVTIVSDLDGLCLDVPRSDASNGVDLILWDCHQGNNQKWQLNNDGSISSSLDNNKCIEVQGWYYNNGTPIEVQDCNSSNPAQQWDFLTDGTIQSLGNPSYCIDGNGFDNVVYLWTCDGSSDQYWTPIPEVAIVSDLGGLCLDIPGSDASNGVDLILWNCHQGNNQKWLLNNDGSISSSLDNNKCIEVQGSVYSSGTPIEVQDCNSGNPAQRWNYLSDGTIQSVGHPSYCIDGNGFDNLVYLWTCDGSSDQYWTLG